MAGRLFWAMSSQHIIWNSMELEQRLLVTSVVAALSDVISFVCLLFRVIVSWLCATFFTQVSVSLKLPYNHVIFLPASAPANFDLFDDC